MSYLRGIHGEVYYPFGKGKGKEALLSLCAPEAQRRRKSSSSFSVKEMIDHCSYHQLPMQCVDVEHDHGAVTVDTAARTHWQEAIDNLIDRTLQQLLMNQIAAQLVRMFPSDLSNKMRRQIPTISYNKQRHVVVLR